MKKPPPENVMIRVELFTPEHYERMGVALWIFCRLVAAQTKPDGLVLGGMPLTYAELSKRFGGFHEQMIRRAVKTLRDERYIEVKHLNYKMLRIRILNQKKFDSVKQGKLDFKATDERRKVDVTKGNGLSKVDVTASKSGRSKQTLEVELEYKLKPDIREETALAPLPPLLRSPLDTPEGLSESQAFAIFWSSYPLDSFAGKAFLAFHETDATAHLGEVLAGLELWKQSGAFDDLAHAYFAHNFLRQKIWNENPRPRKESRHEKRSRNNASNIQEILGRHVEGMAGPVRRPLPARVE